MATGSRAKPQRCARLPSVDPVRRMAAPVAGVFDGVIIQAEAPDADLPFRRQPVLAQREASGFLAQAVLCVAGDPGVGQWLALLALAQFLQQPLARPVVRVQQHQQAEHPAAAVAAGSAGRGRCARSGRSAPASPSASRAGYRLPLFRSDGRHQSANAVRTWRLVPSKRTS